MLVVLAGGGKPKYQHIYREAAEVFWDNAVKGFKAPAPRKWDHSECFNQIVSVVASGLDVKLKLSKATIWINVPEQAKAKIWAALNT